MAKKSGKVLNFVVWLTGVIVSLAVGFSLTAWNSGGLAVPYIGVVNAIAGWIVVITTLLSVVLSLLEK